MMRNIVLVNLNHGRPRAFLVLQAGFTADTGDLRVIGTRGDKSSERVFLDGSIGVDHEQVLVEFGINSDNVVDLMEHFEFERAHRGAVMDTVEEAEEENLGVTLSSVSWLGNLGRLANFDNNNVGDDAAFKC